MQELYANLYNGITTTELEKAMVMVARQRIETEPAYNKVATRLVLNIVYRQALGEVPTKQDHDMRSTAASSTHALTRPASRPTCTIPELLTYDLEKLAAAMHPKRDETFTYLGSPDRLTTGT